MRSTEEFWRGAFGYSYTERCSGERLIASNHAFFDKAFEKEGWPNPCSSIIEFGANRGLNILALKRFKGIRPKKITAVEINDGALSELRKIEDLDVVSGSMLDFETDYQYDLAFTKGVLIHISPVYIGRAYSALYNASRRYILIAEYFNPTPVEIPYRGHSGKLWKRDFAGEMLDLYPDLKRVDYGFVWRRDPVAPQDDLTWFLLEKA